MQEIERKFLVKNNDYKALSTKSFEVMQCYLSTDPKSTTRVRIMDNTKGFITIKGISNKSGVSRYEWEKEIPINDAKELMNLCENLIEKTRYIIPNGKLYFEVDVFLNRKLVLAEIELPTKDHKFNKPSWLGKEVTGKKKYYNSNISKGGFKTKLFKWLSKGINKILFISVPFLIFLCGCYITHNVFDFSTLILHLHKIFIISLIFGVVSCINMFIIYYLILKEKI